MPAPDVHLVLAGLLEAAALLDSRGRLVWSNDAFLRLAQVEDGTGLGIEAFWDTPVPWSAVLSGAQPQAKWEGVFLGQEGRRTAVRASILAVDHGFLLGVLDPEGQRLDHTSQSQKLAVLGQLSGGIAHDLNNMLGILLGMADLIKSTLPDEDPLQESVDLILQTLVRAAALSEKMLNFARQTPQVRAPFGLTSLLKELQFLTRTALPPGVEASFDVEPGAAHTEGDENALLSALLNLVINAGEAQPGGGSVKVCGRQLDQDVYEVVVEDAGPGMDPEMIRRIFEPFYSTKLEQKGTGLGLSLAKKTIQDHGGSIAVDSSPGKGTRVTVKLPILK